MKKYLWISSILAFVTLIICSFILFFNIDWENIKKWTAGYQNQHEQIFQDYDTNYLIDLDIKNASVEILPATNEDIKVVSYYNRSKNIFDVQATKEKLHIIKTINSDIEISFLKLSSESPGKIIIYLPEKLNPTIQITGTNGKIHIYDIQGEKLTARTTNGLYDLSGLNFKTEIALQSTNGAIESMRLTAQNISFVTTNGWINCSELTATDRILLKSTNGVLETSDLYAKDVSLLTRNGSIDLVNMLQPEYEIETLRTNTQFGEVHIDARYKNRIDE